MSGRMSYELRFGRPQPQRAPVRSEREPRQILVLGNFSGNPSAERAPKPISQRALHGVDVDTFDTVLARLKPRINLGAVGGHAADFEFEISELDGLHPDALFRKLDIFRMLRDTRRRLLDPASFAQAAAELRPRRSAAPPDRDSGAEVGTEGGASLRPDRSAPTEDDAVTLERLLGKPVSDDVAASGSPALMRGKPGSPRRVDLKAFIRDLVAPHIVPEADPRQEVYVASLDAAIQDQMRAVLHHPAFQSTESLWRSLHWLVTTLEIGEETQLSICDLTREEMLADLQGAADNLENAELYRLLVEQGIGTPGGMAWSLVVGDFYLGHAEEDVFLLEGLGAMASRAGAPFLAGAKSEILGCRCLADNPDPATWSVEDPADAQRWLRLRRSLHASWLGLALPRVLSRIPYGPGSDEVEAFPFEELPGDPEHESFLWGNPAFACCLLLNRTVPKTGGAMQPRDLALGGLPAYAYYRDGSKVLKPCAEVLLSDRAGLEVLQRGLMPFLSHRGSNMISLPRFQSLADPAKPLGGLGR